MTRREEIEQESKGVKYLSCTPQEIFVKGAEWADKTMIDKACEWLKENQDKYIEIKDGKLYVKRSMVIDLRKAMEE